ncbi:hypothetical protein [Pseudoruegeria sp. HB172150]|uniref:hypothetical protein n=1 Tax=Pseudoruegeria sp. HB172150 TaxID=2721164 RepID=UPI0015519DA5|nr:hypothetical protein [Pseudoruegeria sp. HB172150]
MLNAIGTCLAGPEINACLQEEIGQGGILLMMLAVVLVLFLVVRLMSPKPVARRDPAHVDPRDGYYGGFDGDFGGGDSGDGGD